MMTATTEAATIETATTASPALTHRDAALLAYAYMFRAMIAECDGCRARFTELTRQHFDLAREAFGDDLLSRVRLVRLCRNITGLSVDEISLVVGHAMSVCHFAQAAEFSITLSNPTGDYDVRLKDRCVSIQPGEAGCRGCSCA